MSARDDREELLLVWKLDGPRFSKHRLDLRDLTALSALGEVLVSTATHLWARDRGSASNLFDRVRLVFYKVEEGCAQVPIHLVFEPEPKQESSRGKQQSMFPTDEDHVVQYMRTSVSVTAENAGSYARNQPRKHDLPGSITGKYPDIFPPLTTAETGELAIPAARRAMSEDAIKSLAVVGGVPIVPLVVIDAEQRDAISAAVTKEKDQEAQPTPQQPPAEPEKTIRAHVEQPGFRFQRRISNVTTSTKRAWVHYQGREIGITYAQEHAAEVLDAYKNRETHELTVVGTATYDGTGELVKIEALTYAKSVRVAHEQAGLFDVFESAFDSVASSRVSVRFSAGPPTKIAPVTASKLLTGTDSVVIGSGQSHAMGEPVQEPQSLRNLDDVTFDEFVANHLALRDNLAIRAMTGELTTVETAHLEALNAALDRLLPKPPPPPGDVVNALAELRRLLGE